MLIMTRNFFWCVLLVIGAFSCRSSKDYLERSNPDKSLQDAVKKLCKDANNAKATEAIPILYANIKARRLDKIELYKTSKELSRWDNILQEYQGLQNAYDVIMSCPAAFKLVTPQSFNANIVETNQLAAQEYYNYGNSFLSASGKENARVAYKYFLRCDRYSPGFKDVREKIQLAFKNATVVVVINPVDDGSFFYNNGWGNYGANYNNEYFQLKLLRDLSINNRYPAIFYTDWEIKRERVSPDWAVDLRLRNIETPRPKEDFATRNVHTDIKVGKDSTGKPIYKTVYATLQVTKSHFIAWGEMEVNMRDLFNRKSFGYRMFKESFRWEQETATYSGDSRALSNKDWELVNNKISVPRKEEVLNELYKKIYPQVLNHIQYAVAL
jgi:hypothetical protein